MDLIEFTDQQVIRFKMSIAKAMDRLHTEKYSLNDASKEREPQHYLQNIQLYAAASGVQDRHAQLMWAWQNLDVEIRAVVTMPTAATTVQAFAEELEAKRDLWKAMDERRRPQGRQADNTQSRQQSQYNRPRQQFIADRPYLYSEENARSQYVPQQLGRPYYQYDSRQAPFAYGRQQGYAPQQGYEYPPPERPPNQLQIAAPANKPLAITASTVDPVKSATQQTPETYPIRQPQGPNRGNLQPRQNRNPFYRGRGNQYNYGPPRQYQPAGGYNQPVSASYNDFLEYSSHPLDDHGALFQGVEENQPFEISNLAQDVATTDPTSNSDQSTERHEDANLEVDAHHVATDYTNEFVCEVQPAKRKTCRKCKANFPSGNQLHTHLRFCRGRTSSKLKSTPRPESISPVNPLINDNHVVDEEDKGDVEVTNLFVNINYPIIGSDAE